MDHQEPTGPQDPTIDELIEALNGMRDALVCASLALQDYQFQADAAQRGAAAKDANVLIEKVKPR